MRDKLVQLLTASVVGAVLLLSFGVVSGLAADKTIEATNSISTWTGSPAQITPGGTVEFKNTVSLSHGLNWNAANPEVPGCNGNIPAQGSSGGNWSGTCTFTQAGTYNFVCPVHAAMTGHVTVGTPTPSVTAESATNIKATEATLKGSVNPNGVATMYFFEYGTSAPAYGQATPEESAGSGSTSSSKSKTVTGLVPSTVYHFRMVAKYGSGEVVNGADRTFTTTEPPGPPTATTNPATSIGPVSATLKGTVNPKGLETKYFFEYGTDTGYGQKTGEVSAGSGFSDVAASQALGGLSPLTEYHFRLVAKNSEAPTGVVGGDRTFTTTGGPVATTGQASGIGETSATVAGVVNPQGQQTGYFFNYGTTTSYGQKTGELSAGNGSTNKDVSAQLTGLSPGTTYHFQLVAKNSGGTTTGQDGTFTTSSTPPPPPPPTPPAPPAPAPLPPPAPVAPDTKITAKVPAKTSDKTPTIKFSATVAGATFQCSVDTKPFKACRSPFTAPSLKPGRHKIRVKAVAGGLSDPTPASVSFKVVAKKKK